MALKDVAAALHRARSVFERRPRAAVDDDAPATARWEGNTRVVSSHANGTEVQTDMPAELGGSGEGVTPGWLFRAGIASCAATSVAFAAADRGIELDALEVRASSRSDARGMLGMAEAGGEPVHAGPHDLRLEVRIRAKGVAPEALRALVEAGLRCSPMPAAVQKANALALKIDAG